MAILSLDECLDFVDVSRQYFIINSTTDVLILAYDSGTAANVSLTDGTYSGADLATHMKTQIDTALSCTSTVSYSSTTLKFTFDATSGHTFTYTHSGSDAGLLVGLNQNHSAARTITSDEETGDPTAMVTLIRNAVEDAVQSYCRRTFESTAYSLERYNGTGKCNLFLKNYPITVLTRLAIGTIDAIEVYNTYEYSTASISVTSTGLVLTRDGSADATLLFADYATMTLLAAAVVDTGLGWYAILCDSDYGSYASTELIKMFGRSCIDSNAVNLKMPDRAEDSFDVYEDRGQIVLNGGAFPQGHNNILVDYTAGYSSDDMPEDLKLGIKIAIKSIYQKRSEETFGLKGYSVDGMRIEYDVDIPLEARNIFFNYRRFLV